VCNGNSCDSKDVLLMVAAFGQLRSPGRRAKKYAEQFGRCESSFHQLLRGMPVTAAVRPVGLMLAISYG
jgi:hypothetical protein